MIKCWEFKKCGREKGGDNEQNLGICPAYPDYGDCCAPVAGTLSAAKAQCTYAKKLGTCVKCDFYASEYYRRDRTPEVLNEIWDAPLKEFKDLI